MTNKDSIINGYKVLAEKLDELYLDLTIRQLQELDGKLEETWQIIKPRGNDRRKR
jgi:hypothetical protein